MTYSHICTTAGPIALNDKNKNIAHHASSLLSFGTKATKYLRLPMIDLSSISETHGIAIQT